MKKYYLILLLGLLHITQSAFSQESFFDWSSASSGANLIYVDFEVMQDQSVVAIAKGEGAYYSGPFYQANGEKVSIHLDQRETAVIAFSPEGNVLWFKTVGQYQGEIYQVEKNAQGEILVLVHVEASSSDYDEYEYEYGEEEEYQEEEEADEETPKVYRGSLPDFGLERVESGYHFLHLSIDGKLIKNVYAPVLEDIIGNHCHFHAYIDGKYLVADSYRINELAEKLGKTQFRNSGEYILALGSEGQLLWGDLIFNREGEGDYGSTRKKVTYSPDGTIYLWANSIFGATFSNGLQTLVPLKYEESKRGSGYNEGYLVSYSPTGDINWIKTEESRSRIINAVATNEGIFVSHYTSKNKFFGEIVDTTNRTTTGVTYLNKEGEYQWTRMMGVSRIEDMDIDPQGNVIILGTDPFHRKTGVIGSFTLPEKDESFLTLINPKGEVKWLKSRHLFIYPYNEPYLMNTDKKGSIFIAGQISLSRNLDLNWIDPGFPSLKSDGNVSFIGKVK